MCFSLAVVEEVDVSKEGEAIGPERDERDSEREGERHMEAVSE